MKTQSLTNDLIETYIDQLDKDNTKFEYQLRYTGGKKKMNYKK